MAGYNFVLTRGPTGVGYLEAMGRRGRIVDGAVAIGCALGTTPPVVAGSTYGYFDWRPPLWVWLPVAVGVGAAAWSRRSRPLWFAGVALLAWVLLSAIVAVVVAQYTVAERHRSWRITTGTSLVTLVVVGIPIWWLGGFDASAPLSVAICVAPALLGLYVGTRRELLAELRERAERAERDQELRIRQARSEERNQIARDMHDVVTHRVSLMVLQTTALEAAEGRNAIPLARQIAAIGREALDELRALVEVLRTDSTAPLAPQPGLADLDELVSQSRRLGLPVTLELTGEPAVKPPVLVEHALYRVVQEALTNVRKHAGDATTKVRVDRTPDEVRLAVVNGRGVSAEARRLPGGGHGLLGIAERVRLVGGELTTQATLDGGFRVEVRVPLAEPGA